MNAKRSTPNAKRPMGLLPSTFHVSRFTFDVRPSLRALVWKEWRQLRGVYVLLLLLGGAAAASGPLWSWFSAAGAAFVVLTLGCPIVLSAAAFAGERESDTQRFLLTLPASVRHVVLVKLSTVVVLSLVSAPLTIGFAMETRVFALRFLSPDWAATCLAVVVPCTVLPAVSLVVSSLGAGVMATTLGTFIGGAALLAWLLACVAFFARCTGTGFWPPAWTVLSVAPFVVAATRLACRTALGHRPARLRAAVLALGCVALCAAAPAAYYAWALTAMTPAHYLIAEAKPWRGMVQRGTTAFPGRRHVAVECHLGDWARGTRVALLDVETGEWQWFDRLYGNGVRRHYPTSPWSPDDTKCLLVKSRGRIWPPKTRGPGFYWRQAELYDPPHGIWLFDGRTGHFQHRPSPTGGIDGWFDSDTVYCTEQRGVRFIDTATGEESWCATPRRVTGEDAERRPWGTSVCTAGTGVVGTLWLRPGKQGNTRLILWRHAPDLAEAEVHVLEHNWPREASLVAVAPGGRWLLVSGDDWTDGDVPRVKRVCLASLDTGSVADLPPPPVLGPGSLCAYSSPAVNARFVGDRLHFVLQDGVISYDLAEGAWGEPLRLGHELPRGGPVWGVFHNRVFSPNGRYALVPARLGRREHVCHVIDMHTREHWEAGVWTNAGAYPWESGWLGDDRILVHTPGELWTVRRDGSGKRKLLP